jgi:hypothetical protein
MRVVMEWTRNEKISGLSEYIIHRRLPGRLGPEKKHSSRKKGGRGTQGPERCERETSEGN